MRFMTLLGASSLLAATGAIAATTPTAADRQPPEKSPGAMSSREIAAYNQGLDKSHPFFIRCRRDPMTGTLAPSERVCKTNKDWGFDAAVTRQAARESVERTASGSTSGN
jgi:hypothetical protein